MLTPIARYLGSLGNGQVVLWCYFLWYLGTVACHFDPNPALWLNSLGIALVIGLALVLSVGGIDVARRAPRQTARLFAMPFCVSSFAALIKDRGFWFVLPPTGRELALNLALCAGFVVMARLARRRHAAAAANAC